jgi:hypothetical protein
VTIGVLRKADSRSKQRRMDPEASKQAKDHLFEALKEIRHNVLEAVEKAVKDTTFTVGEKALSDWNSYYCGLGLAGNLIGICGSLVSPMALPGAVAGAILGGLGGTLQLYATFQQNFGKPDFAPQQQMVDGMKERIVDVVRATKNWHDYDIWRVNPIKDALWKRHPELHRTDCRSECTKVAWRALFPKLNPRNYENQIARLVQKATYALFSLIVEFYQNDWSLAEKQIAKLPHRYNYRMGRAGVTCGDNGPDPAQVKAVRDALLRPDRFFREFCQTSEYKQWRHTFAIVPIPH